MNLKLSRDPEIWVRLAAEPVLCPGSQFLQGLRAVLTHPLVLEKLPLYKWVRHVYILFKNLLKFFLLVSLLQFLLPCCLQLFTPLKSWLCYPLWSESLLCTQTLFDHALM